jgi:hypothetical protein
MKFISGNADREKEGKKTGAARQKKVDRRPAREENGMNNRSRKWKFREKAIFAAALLVIFGTVVFSVPHERLAWQGPLVMGTLAMPALNPTKLISSESRSSSDSLFSFMGFMSVAGILALTGRRLLTKPDPLKPTDKVVLPLIFP